MRVNRLLLNNIEVIGAGWGAYVLCKPDRNREIGAEVTRWPTRASSGRSSAQRFPLERAAEALKVIDERRATGKVVLELGD